MLWCGVFPLLKSLSLQVFYLTGVLLVSACTLTGTLISKVSSQRVGEHQIVDFSNVAEAKGSGTWRNVFVLNFEGAEITSEQSFIVRRAGLESVSIPKFDPADIGMAEDARADIINRITDIIAEVYKGYEISFTTSKPASGGFSVMHIGGQDFRPNKQVLGVAPLDIDNFSARDVGFAFSKNIDPEYGEQAVTVLAAVIAHEIAHCLGARHISHQLALMNPAVGPDNLQLLSAPVVGGSGLEDTAELVRRNIGLARHGSDAALATAPRLVNLGFFAQQNVRQYTVYTPANVAANPAKNLGLYRYRWQVGAREMEGSNIRIPLSQLADSIAVSIEAENGMQKYVFNEDGSLKQL